MELFANSWQLRHRSSDDPKPSALERMDFCSELFFKNAPASIALFDSEMRYLACSDKWKSQLKVGDDVIGRSHYDVFPNLPERWKEVNRRCLSGAIEKSEEDFVVQSDGKVDYFRWETRPWYKTDGSIGGLVVFCEVITDRKAAEMQLARREEEQRFLSDATKLLTVPTNLESQFQSLASLAVPLLCDHCRFDILDDQNNLYTAAVASRDLIFQERARKYLRTRKIPLSQTENFLVKIFNRNTAHIEKNCGRQWQEKHAHGPEHLRLMAELNPTCILALPILYGEKRLGVLSFCYTDNRKEFGADDVRLGEELARRVSIAFENARLYEETQQARNDLERFLNCLPNMAWMGSGNGDPEFRNLQCYSYTGFDPSKKLGLSEWFNTIHPDDLPRIAEKWRESVERLETFEADYRVRRHDGQYRWHLVRYIPTKDSRGTVTWTGTATDIHTKRRSEDRQSFLSEASKTLFSSLDPETISEQITQLVVPRFADWCTVAIAPTQGEKSVHSILAHADPEVLKRGREVYQKYGYNPNFRGGSAEVLREGKSILVSSIDEETIRNYSICEEHFEAMKSFNPKSAIVVPIKVADQILGVLRLISCNETRKYTQSDLEFTEEIAQLLGLAVHNAQLYSQVKDAIRVRDEFLSIASHELRTPLTTLMVHLGMTAKKVNSPDQHLPLEKLKKVLEISNRQVDRLSVLINDLFDVAKIRSGQFEFSFERMDLKAVLEDIVEKQAMLDPNFRSKIKIEMPESVETQWDRQRIEQVINNLLSNALKYAPGSNIIVSAETKNSYVHLSVKDFGPGIPKDKQKIIFDRFERVEDVSKVDGLGLGLYIVKQIVAAHKGTIQLQSDVNEGCTFVIVLPLNPSAPSSGT